MARDTEEMTPAGDLCPPTFDLTTTTDSGDEDLRLRGMNILLIPACESYWSMGSSIAEEPEVAEEGERGKEDRKMLNKRRRLLSLISLLSPTTKKEKELKTGTPPYPTALSVYLPSQESLIISASTHSTRHPIRCWPLSATTITMIPPIRSPRFLRIL